MLENKAGKKSKEQSNTEWNRAKHEELSYDYKGRVPDKLNRLQMLNRVEQNDRHDVVSNALAEDAAEKFRLFRVVNNAHCWNHVWAAQ